MTAATLRRFSTSALISIRAPRSATKATIPNQTATPRANAEYVRQSRIDPTPRICPPSFRKHSTRHGHASNKQSASSNASSASHFDARRRRRITARSSRCRAAQLKMSKALRLASGRRKVTERVVFALRVCLRASLALQTPPPGHTRQHLDASLRS